MILIFCSAFTSVFKRIFGILFIILLSGQEINITIHSTIQTTRTKCILYTYENERRRDEITGDKKEKGRVEG